MFSKKSLLAVSILFAAQNVSFAANVAEYNYNPNLTKQQTGVDISSVIDCGYNYANSDCDSSKPSVQKGYADATNINKGTGDGRTANSNKDIYDSSNTKNLGINQMDDNSSIAKYSDTRDLSKQQSVITDLYGGGGSVDNLKATYNTNVIPDGDGLTLKNKCMQYSDDQLSSMAQSSTKATVDLANQCLVIRTVANSNDQALVSGFTDSDPLRKAVVDRADKNIKSNNYVANVKTTGAAKANEQTYACDTEPTRSEYLSSTCNTQAIGRQQICTQDRVIVCGTGATGTRDLPECASGMDRGTVKLTSSSNGLKSSFVSTDTGFSLYERWQDGPNGSVARWEFNFLVKNPDKVDMTFVSFYYDNKVDFILNGTRIAGADNWSSDGSSTINLKLQKQLRVGQNTFVVDMVNYHGPAGVAFNIAINPSTYVGCMCKESWKTTCNISKVGI